MHILEQSIATQRKFCLQHSRKFIRHFRVAMSTFLEIRIYEFTFGETISLLQWVIFALTTQYLDFQGFWLQLAFLNKTNAFFQSRYGLLFLTFIQMSEQPLMCLQTSQHILYFWNCPSKSPLLFSFITIPFRVYVPTCFIAL